MVSLGQTGHMRLLSIPWASASNSSGETGPDTAEAHPATRTTKSAPETRNGNRSPQAAILGICDSHPRHLGTRLHGAIPNEYECSAVRVACMEQRLQAESRFPGIATLPENPCLGAACSCAGKWVALLQPAQMDGSLAPSMESMPCRTVLRSRLRSSSSCRRVI